jgi:hypothetical protein
MRKSIILAASLGTMFISSAAFAATTGVTGAIKSIQFKSHTITLSNGKTYTLPTRFVIKNLKVGERVSIAYVVKNKHFVATSVKAL